MRTPAPPAPRQSSAAPWGPDPLPTPPLLYFGVRRLTLAADEMEVGVGELWSSGRVAAVLRPYAVRRGAAGRPLQKLDLS